MVKREANELLPTLKVNPKKEDANAVQFKDCQVVLESFKDVETKHGKKVIANVTHQKENKKYSVFVNATSMTKLIEAFGDDDDHWKGKICDLKKETDPTFDNEMIVFHPVK